MTDQRPDPDQLLQRLRKEEDAAKRGQLKLFFGASPGVGKTYSMLEAARQRVKEGVDVLIGVVETHGRAETAALLDGLVVLPRSVVDYKGVALQEFDLDAALKRHPTLILMDELAHTNAPGSRHAKRWQDVEELLDAGINVYTTLNVQHWESLNDIVAQITGVVVRETVPDTFLTRAHDVELVDLSPEDLLRRLKDGKVYRGDQAGQAADHFFQPGNLIALRELALRHVAERVDAQVQAFKENHSIQGVWPVSDRLLVGVTASPMSARLVRATHRLAAQVRAPWIVVTVDTPDLAKRSPEDRSRLANTMRLAERLGGETVSLSGSEVAETVLRYARSRNVTKIVVGKPARARWREWLSGSIVDDLARRVGDIDLYIISGVGAGFSSRSATPSQERIVWQHWIAAAGMVFLATLLCWPLSRLLDKTNLVMIYLSGIIAVAYYFGRAPSMAASVAAVLCFDFFYVPPYFTFAVSDTQYLLTFAVMLGTGLLISALTGRLRQQSDTVQEREAQTRLLYRLSRELSETPVRAVLLDKARRQLEEFYRTPVLLLTPDATGKLDDQPAQVERFGLDEKERGVADWVYHHDQEAGRGTTTLAGAAGIYVPLKGIQSVVGVLAVRPGPSTDLAEPAALHLLETFASEIGGALESTEMSEAAGRAQVQIESERWRNLLLTTFSADLREPLSTICDNAAALIQSPTEPERGQLVERIQSATAQLQTLTDHLSALLAPQNPPRQP